MKIVVLYEGFNTMSEGIQIVLLASVSGITDRYVKISAIKGEDRWKYHPHTDGEL